jgi:SAM-dependent methyltransferase
MGISIDAAKFLAKARKDGVRFDETLTLGRQHMLIKTDRLADTLRHYDLWPPPQGEAAFYQSAEAEFPMGFNSFARALGAKKISSCDASPYEGADFTHDLNQPIPAELEGRFDVVIDGGTLEHVFNFPVAIANCMRMVREGGHVILFTPANNYFGHGFYQFSPELFYRVLAPGNGFEVTRMVALSDNVGIGSFFGIRYYFSMAGPWYAVSDPAKIGKRVPLISHDCVILMILAKKISTVPIFNQTPQQSDYVPRWKDQKGDNLVSSPKKKHPMLAGLERWFTNSYYSEAGTRLAWLLNPFRLRRFRRKNSFQNRSCYQRMDD